jgi:hypothetical protein
MAGGAPDRVWKVMDLTHGLPNGTLNPDPTNTEITLRALRQFPAGALPPYRYVWLLPEKCDGAILREVAEDGRGKNLDVLWAELERPSAGSFWEEWGVDNPVVELTMEERLFVALAQIVVGRGRASLKKWAAAEIMKKVVEGKRRLSERYPFLVPEKVNPEFEGTEEYIRFLGQPLIDPGNVSETVNYLEF